MDLLLKYLIEMMILYVLAITLIVAIPRWVIWI